MSGRTYYVYRHVRLDTNEVFYVGKGTAILKGKSEKTYYYRAFSRQTRSNYWCSIVNKTNFLVEILFQSCDENAAYKKEKELIKLYGRSDLGEGTLVNFSDGGIENSNRIISYKTKIKMSDSAKKRISPLAGRSKIKVWAYKVDGTFYKEYPSVSDAQKDLNISIRGILCCLRGEYQQTKGFIFNSSYQGEKIPVFIQPPLCNSPVLVFDSKMNFLYEFSSISAASRALKIARCDITSCASKKKTCKSYYFSIKKKF